MKEALAYLTGAFLIFIYIMIKDIGYIPIDNGLLLFSADHFTFEFLGSSVGLKGGRFLNYYLLFGAFGIFLGYLVSRNYKLDYVIFLSLSVYMGIVVFAFIISGFIGGFERFIENYSHFVDKKTNSYMNIYLMQIDNYRSVLSSRGVDYSILEKKAEVAAEVYKNSVLFGIAPRGGYLIKQLVVIFISILFVKLYFKRKLNKAAFSFNIKN